MLGISFSSAITTCQYSVVVLRKNLRVLTGLGSEDYDTGVKNTLFADKSMP